MATYTVTTTADTLDPSDGQLSLREALALADADPATADTIDFAPEVQGARIVLAGSQLTVNSDVAIDGGAGVTLDANHQSRVLLVQDGLSNPNDVALRDLTITGGLTTADNESGGGIWATASSNLTLAHTTVVGNATTGANAFGGGVAGNYIALTDSTVAENSTSGAYADGGGISAAGRVSLSNCTVADNSAYGDGATGGGINAYRATLINTTVSGNGTIGAGSNGGGVYARNASVANSILAGNVATGPDPDIAVYSGHVFSNGSNIFGSHAEGSTPGDREGVPTSVLFAGGLADNGGSTPTLALLDDPANPALGRAAPVYAAETDQRGVPRPQPDGTHPDIGAFELNQSAPTPPPAPSTFVVTTVADVVADDGKLSLREALALADADSSTADRIEFAQNVQGHTIRLAQGQLTANSDVTIDGGSGVTVDAHHASRVLLVQGLGTDVRLQHLTITGGRTTDDYDGGAGIRADQYTTLNLDHATVRGNRSTGEYAGGGGILGSVVTLNDSRVIHNSAVGQGAHGGGISGGYGSVTLNNSTVSDNSVHGRYAQGGAIALDQNSFGSTTLNHCEVSNNSATGYESGSGGIAGGGQGSGVTLTESTVSRNRGGGIAGYAVTLTASTVSENHHGFGIAAHLATLTSSTVTDNDGGLEVHGYFAGHYTVFGMLHLNSSTISGNHASGDYLAGGVTLFASQADIANSVVVGNAATSEHPDIFGRVARSNGHNIFGSMVDGATASDFQNVPTTLLFAGHLGDHGGPTETLALRGARNNPALGSADPVDSPAVDQRGEVRPQPAGTAPDVGAFESTWAPATPARPFDGLEYIASYRDLIRAFGPDSAAGFTHYHLYGAGEGRTVRFDGLQYIASYDDLIRSFGANPDAGAVHFITYGEAERRVRDDFDAEQYLANYPDLQTAFGHDTEAATVHYIDYGHAEGRRDEPLQGHAATDFLL